MFISDLNILETVEVSAVVGGTFFFPPAPTKNIVTNTTANQTYNTAINLVKNQAVNAALTSTSYVTGNVATGNVDVTALGANTFTQVDGSITVIAGQLSESAFVGIAAANK